MDRLIEWLVKGLFVLLFGPLLLALVFQSVVALLALVLPWVILLAVVTGVMAGLTAGLVVRRRLPPRQGGTLPESTRFQGEPIRRPRGRSREEE